MSKIWKQYEFWKKVSNYSTILNGLFFILLVFFDKALGRFAFPVALLTALSVMVFVISEIMKFIKKKKGGY